MLHVFSLSREKIEIRVFITNINMSAFSSRSTSQRRNELYIYCNTINRLQKEIDQATTEHDKMTHRIMYYQYVLRCSCILREQPVYRQLIWNNIQAYRKKYYHRVLTPILIQIENIILEQK